MMKNQHVIVSVDPDNYNYCELISVSHKISDYDQFQKDWEFANAEAQEKCGLELAEVTNTTEQTYINMRKLDYKIKMVQSWDVVDS